MNSLEHLLAFLFQLQNARIDFNLKCVRDAIMVTLRSPSTYYEIDFFADGHIEVETFGSPIRVQTMTPQEITDLILSIVNG